MSDKLEDDSLKRKIRYFVFIPCHMLNSIIVYLEQIYNLPEFSKHICISSSVHQENLPILRRRKIFVPWPFRFRLIPQCDKRDCYKTKPPQKRVFTSRQKSRCFNRENMDFPLNANILNINVQIEQIRSSQFRKWSPPPKTDLPHLQPNWESWNFAWIVSWLIQTTMPRRFSKFHPRAELWGWTAHFSPPGVTADHPRSLALGWNMKNCLGIVVCINQETIYAKSQLSTIPQLGYRWGRSVLVGGGLHFLNWELL